MNLHKQFTFYILILLICACNVPENEEILGVWAITSYSVNGYDCTHLVNEPHQQWLELRKKNAFRSGSIKIENEGNWVYNSNTGNIKLTSEAGLEGWGNSFWNVTANSKNLLFKGVQKNGLINILFERKSDLPIAKEYKTTEQDKIVGLWEVDSLYFSNQMNAGNGKWFRIGRSGNFVSGDDTGELFSGSFTFIDSTNQIDVYDPENNKAQHWNVNWESSSSEIILQDSGSTAKLFLSRIQEFGK